MGRLPAEAFHVRVRPIPRCASFLAGVCLGTEGPPLKTEAGSETTMMETES